MAGVGRRGCCFPGYQVSLSLVTLWREWQNNRPFVVLLSSNRVLIKRTSRGEFRSRFGLRSSQTNPSTLHSVHVGLRDVTCPSLIVFQKIRIIIIKKSASLCMTDERYSEGRERETTQGEDSRRRDTRNMMRRLNAWPSDCYFWEQ